MKQVRYCVAGHRLQINFVDAWNDERLIPSFTPFVCNDEGQTLFELTVDDSFSPTGEAEEVGQFDCGGCNHGVYRLADGGYRYEISDLSGTMVCLMETNADFTVNRAALSGSTFVQRNYGLNNALMLAYAFSAVAYDTLLVHASVVRYCGKGVLCLARSGTGKSTHTGLWLKHIPGCDLMNDDNPVVRFVDGEARVYGSPWSGKTPCYRDVEAPIAGFLRIEQRPENTIVRQPTVAAFAGLLPSASSMKWDKRVYNAICATVTRIIAVTPVYVLGCRPDEEAARLSYQTLFGTSKCV